MTFAGISLVVFLLLALPGVVLLAKGLGGRKVSDHPTCRKCGFDLFGRPEGVERCSECGADLRIPGAVRGGLWKKRWGLIVAGAVPLLFSLLLVVGGLVAAGRQIKYIEYAPVWWLVREARNGNAAERDAAIDELRARLGNGKLSASNINRAADAALAVQADRTLPWDRKWGDFVCEARGGKQLDDERWKRFARQAFEFSLEVRPKVRRGDRVPVWIATDHRSSAAGARSGIPDLVLEVRRRQGATGIIKDEPKGSGGSSRGSGGGKTGYGLDVDKQKLAAAPDGPQEISLPIHAAVYEGWNAKTPIVEFDTDLAGKFELVPSDAETVKSIHDESVRPAVEKALRLEQLQLQRSTYGNHIHLTIHADKPPVPLAYDVYIEWGGHSIPCGTVNFAANANGGYGTGGELKKLEPPEKVDIRLKPSLKVALSTTNLTELWDGEVVLKDRPVEDRDRPTSLPTTTRPTQ